jgi:uncharacterized protein
MGNDADERNGNDTKAQHVTNRGEGVTADLNRHKLGYPYPKARMVQDGDVCHSPARTKTLHKGLKILTCLLLLVLLAAFLGGHSEAKSFLWKVSLHGKDLYLLGSTHVADETLYPLSSSIERAFESSDCLVVEADVGSSGSLQNLLKLVGSEGMLPEDQRLADLLSPDLYQRLDREMNSLGLTAAMVGNMRPWLAALTVTQFRMLRLGYRPDLGIDLYFLRKAQGRKPVLELESVDFQIKMLSGFSMPLQVKFLEDSLEDLSATREDTAALFTLWKSGDAAGMEKLLFRNLAGKPGLKDLYTKMLDERNVTMARRLEEYLRQGKTCFVVVGAGHLLGDNGLLRIMKRKGCAISQL